MNKKSFIYSIKFVAVLLALFAFASCNREEFTEQDALDLERERLAMQRSQDSAALVQEVDEALRLEWQRRMIDSLTRVNAGGKVFYSVTVVPGGSSAFGAGRLDEVEGVQGAEITVSQGFVGEGTDAYAFVRRQNTDQAGMATFELYSGEATVNVNIPDGAFTNVSYTVNLTPDGGVQNGSTILVGNVVPVFNNPNSPTTDPDDVARIRGRAFVETDLTNNTPELVADVVDNPDDVTFTANIFTNNEFMERYIRKANEEGANMDGVATNSGAIQRIAYQGATTVARLNGDSDYTLLASATASGLPIRMQFSEFVADRTFWRFVGDDGDLLEDFPLENIGQPNRGLLEIGDYVTRRTLYTPNTSESSVDRTLDFNSGNDIGRSPQTNIGQSGYLPVSGAFWSNVSMVEQNATLSVNITSDGSLMHVPYNLDVDGTTPFDNAIGRVNWLVVQQGATGVDAAAVPGFAGVPNLVLVPGTPGLNGGEYLADVNVNSDAQAGDVLTPAVTFVGGDPTTPAEGYAVLSNELGGAQGNLRTVVAIVLTNVGAGYTSAPQVVIDRAVPNGVGGTGITGTGGIVAASNAIGNVRVIDGGFGFINATTTNPTNEIGRWTGFPPVPAIPDVPTGLNLALQFTYDWETSGGDDLGTVQSIEVVGSSNNWTTGALNELNDNPFQYNSTQAILPIEVGGEDLFDPLTGTLALNAAYPGVAGGPAPFDVPNAIWMDAVGGASSPGDQYVFVPGATVVGGAPEVAATFDVFMDPTTGRVVAMVLTSGGTGYVSGPTEVRIGRGNIAGNTLDAEFFTGGSSVDTYDINGTGFGSIITGRATNPDVADLAAVTPGNNTYHALFSTPTGGGTPAVGVPVFDGNRVVGLEILDAGSGYSPAADNITWTLVPTGTAAAKQAFNASLRSYLTPAAFNVIVNDGGLGYAVNPSIRVSGGNLPLDHPDYPSSSDFAVTVNSAGTITAVRYTGGASPYGVDQNGQIEVIATVAPQEGAFLAMLRGPVFSTGGSATPNFGYTAPVPAFPEFGAVAQIQSFTWQSLDLVAGELEGGFGNWIDNTASIADVIYGAPFRAFSGTNGRFYSAVRATVQDAASDATAAVTFNISSAGGSDNGGRISGVGVSQTGLFAVSRGGNDASMPVEGLPFRTVGGPAGFSTFSAINYVRDIHYGTGIELNYNN
ncbi:MAG: hypothetical protein JJT94_07330 [Bernardetiaceae bacterium]|nr:hypothetical protein [Bernardetiaceae bacterium]